MSDQERELTTETMPAVIDATEQDLLLLEKYSKTFTGTYAHALDGKGRMVIPQAFRDMLGKVFTITPGFDFKSIAVYPEVAYVRMRERQAQIARDSKHPEIAQKFLQFLDALTFRGQECDGQGRVLLPAKLRQKILGDDKEVDIMGACDHLCVAARAQTDAELDDFIANIGTFLREMNS